MTPRGIFENITMYLENLTFLLLLPRFIRLALTII